MRKKPIDDEGNSFHLVTSDYTMIYSTARNVHRGGAEDAEEIFGMKNSPNSTFSAPLWCCNDSYTLVATTLLFADEAHHFVMNLLARTAFGFHLLDPVFAHLGRGL